MNFDLTKIKKALAKNNFDTRERVMFYEELLMGIEDGVSIPEIIKDIHTLNVKKNNLFKVMTNEWLVSFSSGKSFSVSAKSWIPDNELFLIAAGEEKDKLAENIKELIRIVSDQESLIKSIKSKIYPQIFMLFALSVAIYLFSSKLAPGFKKIMKEEQWPEITRVYFSFSDWYVANGPYIIGAIVLFSILAVVSLKPLHGSFRDKLDKLPPWSIYRSIQSAQFLIVVSGMVKSGIALQDILNNLMRHSSPYLTSHLKKMQSTLSKGKSDGEAMDTGLLDEDIKDRILNYSKRSGFHKGILALGLRASKEMITKIEKFADKTGSYINYALYVYVGLTIAALSEMVTGVINSAM